MNCHGLLRRMALPLTAALLTSALSGCVIGWPLCLTGACGAPHLKEATAAGHGYVSSPPLTRHADEKVSRIANDYCRSLHLGPPEIRLTSSAEPVLVASPEEVSENVYEFTCGLANAGTAARSDPH